MSHFLMIDIGAGTMDVLWYDSKTGEHFKAVAPSPVRTISWEIKKTQGPLAITGFEMGGVVSASIKDRARNADVVMTGSAAATLNHDLNKVRACGIRIASEEFVAAAFADPGYSHFVLGDIQPEAIKKILTGFGLPTHFDAVVLCAQDHGMAPVGVSHLDFRHNLFVDLLTPAPQLHKLLFRSDEIPPAFSRLVSMAQCAAPLDADEVFVMDSGMAAIIGASQDVQIKGKDPVIVLDIATSHTVVATLSGGQPAGFVEYHTRDLTLSRLEELIVDLADGRIDHSAVIAQGGHGAWLRQAVGFTNVQAILATGPKRRLLAESSLPIIWGAPWGDNMMTGTVGLLEALRLRKGLGQILYL
jgi:uncharacterized protein (DUF1786 family)